MKKILSGPERGCDIIIPVWNQLEATRECLRHILCNTKYPYRIIIVDNGSEPLTADFLEEFKKENREKGHLIRNEDNEGFVKAINQGLKASRAPYVCFMNNDTMPGEGWLTELVSFAESHKEAGLLNPLCKGHIQKNMTIDEYARIVALNRGKYMEMNQCQGFCMLVKRSVIDKIGYLDETFGIGGFDDTDYSRRAHGAGYTSVSVHSAYVYHEEHKSFNAMGDRKGIQAAAEKAYFKKWPKHRRIVIIFSITKGTDNSAIAHFLNSALYLVREWCWVNLFIFGDKNTRSRVEEVKKEFNFPLHQNMKFNYLNRKFKIPEITVRMIERAFGTKKRKKYDALIYGDRKMTRFVRFLCGILKCGFLRADFGTSPKNILEKCQQVSRQDIKCDIILPVCDQYDFIKNCIESIIRNTDIPYRLIIINNGKSPNVRKYLDDLDKNEAVETTVIHSSHNIGWVKALNKGMKISRAPYICFQNDDTIVTRGWLKKMINILNIDPRYGMVNPVWDGRPSNISIDKYNEILERKNRGNYIETDWCRGFSVVLKRDVIKKIGKVDEIYGLAYFDDVDYSVTAIEAGFLCIKALDTYIYHHRNVTSFELFKGEKWNELHEKNKLIYYKKWGKPLKISVILDREASENDAYRKQISDMIYSLARKQHRLYVWCSDKKIANRLVHTNIVIKNYPISTLKLMAGLDLYLNARKRLAKRYDAVFVHNARLGDVYHRRFSKSIDVITNNNNENFQDFVIRTVNKLKEKTKENIHVPV